MLRTRPPIACVQAVAAGVAGIVYPHARDARQSKVSAGMIPEVWPGNDDGRLLDVLIVEDKAGIANVSEIAATAGPSIIFSGPGDLRRSYEGDMEAVEKAIQAVLAACKANDVPCGITARSNDIAKRLEEGFRVIIVLEPEALAVGRAAAGRTD